MFELVFVRKTSRVVVNGRNKCSYAGAHTQTTSDIVVQYRNCFKIQIFNFTATLKINFLRYAPKLIGLRDL